MSGPGFGPRPEEQDKRWSEGYAAFEYECLELLEDVSHSARSLFFAARIWSSRKATDGIIPRARLRGIAATAGVSARGASTAADELVNAGAWDNPGTGDLRDIGFLTANNSRLKRETQREKWRKQKENQRANPDSLSSDEANVHGGQGPDIGADCPPRNETYLNETELNVSSNTSITTTATSANSRVGDSDAGEDEGTWAVIAAGTAWFAERGERRASKRKLAGLCDLAFDGALEPWHLVTALDIAEHRGHAEGYHPNQVIEYVTDGHEVANGRGCLLGRVIAGEEGDDDDDDGLADLRAAAGGSLVGDRR